MFDRELSDKDLEMLAAGKHLGAVGVGLGAASLGVNVARGVASRRGSSPVAAFSVGSFSAGKRSSAPKCGKNGCS